MQTITIESGNADGIPNPSTLAELSLTIRDTAKELQENIEELLWGDNTATVSPVNLPSQKQPPLSPIETIADNLVTVQRSITNSREMFNKIKRQIRG